MADALTPEELDAIEQTVREQRGMEQDIFGWDHIASLVASLRAAWEERDTLRTALAWALPYITDEWALSDGTTVFSCDEETEKYEAARALLPSVDNQAPK